jgi:hypothetical protein
MEGFCFVHIIVTFENLVIVKGPLSLLVAFSVL